MKKWKSGELDKNFGEQGRFYVGQGFLKVQVRRMRLDSKERILGVGVSALAGTYQDRITAMRIASNGTMDDSFHKGGFFFGEPNKEIVNGTGIAEAEGGVLFVGGVLKKQSLLLRIPVDGAAKYWTLSPDDAVDSYGMPVVELLSDGKILVASNYSDAENIERILLMRRLADGEPDPDFETIVLGKKGESYRLLDMTLRPEHNDVVIALSVTETLSGVFALYCFDLSTGGLKQEFGEGGKFFYQLPDWDDMKKSFKSVTYDEGLWLAGSVGDVTGLLFVFFIRLSVNGTVDMDFNGGNPIVLKGYSPFVVVQGDGKIILCASTIGPNDNVLRRYFPDGSQDLEYGENGIVYVGALGEEVSDLLIQSDEKLIVSVNEKNKAAVLYRFNS